MVAVLFLIGQGHEKPELIDRLLDVEALPEKPMYEMADGHPLVLWECRYPSPEGGDPNGADSLQWLFPDDQLGEKSTRRGPGDADGRYGYNGINEVLWSSWQRKKIDEVLAGQLLDVVASQRTGPSLSSSVSHVEDGATDVGTTAAPVVGSNDQAPVRVFDGGYRLRQASNYTPLLQRLRVQTPEASNARYRDKLERRRAAAGTNGDRVDEDIDE